jgi:alpha,alpha-trehalase
LAGERERWGYELSEESEADTRQEAPAQVFGALFEDVQRARLFVDSKTFADALPRRPPRQILANYPKHTTGEQLRAFVMQNFEIPGDIENIDASPDRGRLRSHIAALWPILTRQPINAHSYSSQLSLAHPHIVPGGRFREVYYWDSYFTLLGAVADGHGDLAQCMVDNFADLIDRYGHVPNGARTYYLSRSQPPVFFLMTALLTPDDPAASYARYLPALLREHAFWMSGEDKTKSDSAIEHVVRLDDGAILNRYWDALDTPRDEAFFEDVALAAGSNRPAGELFRDIRAAAESGWDFSSRWMADEHSLATLETTSIVPVDLNSLLFGLESAIADGCKRAGDDERAHAFTHRAAQRRDAIDSYLWNNAKGCYLDYHWRSGRPLNRPSAATLYPLFVCAAPDRQARAVAEFVRENLLGPGGLRTTLVRSGQQWDAPNGWAPNVWVAVRGLNRYGEADLARAIAERWLATVNRTFADSGMLVEKYDIEEVRPGGGGEYPLQDGFGWTNGVTRALLCEYSTEFVTNAPSAGTAK